jgi:hypothetical protein
MPKTPEQIQGWKEEFKIKIDKWVKRLVSFGQIEEYKENEKMFKPTIFEWSEGERLIEDILTSHDKAIKEELVGWIEKRKKSEVGFDLGAMARGSQPFTIKSAKETAYNQALEDIKDYLLK